MIRAKRHYSTTASKIKIIIPPQAEKSYAVAGETFGNLWEKITGAKPTLEIGGHHLPKGHLVLVGSDAVNPAARELIMQNKIKKFDIRYGMEDYHILSVRDAGRFILILAGACGRSTIYAVYDFFERRGNARYFWDGDIIPARKEIRLADCNYVEKPHFHYRGLRYFAHRGLHRFQAEHWNFDDWKREIDWLLKKRMNMFMLRTGIDDLFQRAFPKSCPYPPLNDHDPDAVLRSYDDRTSFWPLKYRGELRKKVLQYAFDRELLHPEDTGTITHWYSHTPSSFYKHNPDFPVLKQNTPGYNTVTGRVWDIFDERAWQAYWRLTATHIKEFGQTPPRLFHTIGLAERGFGKTKAENLYIQRYAYRKIQAIFRQHYPDAPLLVASWGLGGWKNRDVRNLLKELDPKNTVIMDYKADAGGFKNYRDLGTYQSFPWIFGVFHAFAPDSDIGGNYALLSERLREAGNDTMCQGLVFWPELSHSDTFMLEYLARNGWNPRHTSLKASISVYCTSRYSTKIAGTMMVVWRDFFALNRPLRFQRYIRDYTFMFEPHFRLMGNQYSDLTPGRLAFLRTQYIQARKNLFKGAGIFKTLEKSVQSHYADHFWRRDAIDIARTLLNQLLRWTFVELVLNLDAWRKDKSLADRIRFQRRHAQRLLSLLGDVLAQDPDFSIYASFQRLAATTSVNPHTEQTLKGNIGCGYCRTSAYELVRHVYAREFEVYFQWIERRLAAGGHKAWRRPTKEFDAAFLRIFDVFYSTPLKDMAPSDHRSAARLKAIFRQCGEMAGAYKYE